jgi:hypothetical protein
MATAVFPFIFLLPFPAGVYPAARRSHTCNLFENELFLLGGIGADDCFSEVFCLNLASRTWARFSERRQGIWPRPAFFHSSVIDDEGTLVTFGGVVARQQRYRSRASVAP